MPADSAVAFGGYAHVEVCAERFVWSLVRNETLRW